MTPIEPQPIEITQLFLGQALSKIHTLISDGRVEFVAPADYEEKSQLDIIIKGTIGRIARKYGYRPNA